MLLLLLKSLLLSCSFVCTETCLIDYIFYFILFYFILFYFILFYFILFYFILFYFIQSIIQSIIRSFILYSKPFKTLYF